MPSEFSDRWNPPGVENTRPTPKGFKHLGIHISGVLQHLGIYLTDFLKQLEI